LFQTAGDIVTTLEKRQQKYNKFGLEIGPQAVVVMADNEVVMGSYVVVNMVIYEVDKPKTAFDVAFKAMHSLDAVYAVEAKREYQFLQKAVYGFDTAHDTPEEKKLDPKLITLIKAYKDFKN